MARCGCGGTCSCSLVSNDDTTIGGTGSATNPYTVSIKCSKVRTCLSQGNGINYNSSTGVISACLSTNTGNIATFGTDGCLYVPRGGNPVLGCGLSGVGSAASPLKPNVETWPFPCAQETNGSVISCGTDGVLRGEAPYHSDLQLEFDRRFYPNILVPAGSDNTSTPVDTFDMSFTNDDPCRNMALFMDVEVDFYVDMPIGSTAAFGFNNDIRWRHTNNGTTPITDEHVQLTTVIRANTSVAPGATIIHPTIVAATSGTGGATYTQIQVTARSIWLPA